MEENAPVKVPAFQRFSNFLRRLFPEKKKITIESYSKFRLLIMDMSPDDPGYEQANTVADLCEEGVKIARQRIGLINRMRDIDRRLTELESFDRMTDEEITDFQKLLDRHTNVSNERMALIHQIADFDNSLNVMLDVEDDANFAVPHIEDAEKNQRILKSDISQLQGEKADLEYERETLEKGMLFINRFALAMIIIFTSVTIILFYFYLFQRSSIFLPTTIFILLVIVVVSLLFFFRRRMAFELDMNLKKQNKAVELINKKSAVFVYYTSFLNYEYKKYRVRNSQMLKKNLHEFVNYKHITKRIDALRKVMTDTESEIERFLKKHKMGSVKSVIDKYSLTTSLKDKKNYYTELSQEKETIEKNLTLLDIKHEMVWDKLVVLNDNDRTPDQLINKVIHSYIDEVSKIVPAIDK